MKPNFTQFQKDNICYIIGDWYLEWKNNLIYSKGESHNLLAACLLLIEHFRVHYYSDILKMNKSQLEFVIFQINKWHEIYKDNIVSSYKEKTHNLGSKKEILKLMVCDDMKEVSDWFDI